MPSFSERYGYSEKHDTSQIECMDDDLRTSIYNVIYDEFHEHNTVAIAEDLSRQIWSKCWHKALDEFPDYYDDHGFVNALKLWFQECPWNQAYDLVEFIANKYKITDDSQQSYPGVFLDEPPHAAFAHPYLEDFRNEINEALQRERAGYRLVETLVSPITNTAELDSINQVLQASDTFGTARKHLYKALELFSIRGNPDYENTVKESISAIEAAARTVSGNEKATLGAALKSIQKSKKVHPALIEGWQKLYGFTSDAGGIRHAEHPDDFHVDGALAKYMLVSCSGFVNYLIEIAGDDHY
jgi:hypothetical protein